MIYEIHLYVPKTGRLTPAMMDWLFEHGLSEEPEVYWPVRKVKPKPLARLLLSLDDTLIPTPGPADDIELGHADENLGLLLYVHDRGVIIFFPYMAYSVLSQLVVRIAYTYIRHLYDNGGFWSFDPQLNVISFADDFQSIDDTLMLMDAIMPRLLTD